MVGASFTVAATAQVLRAKVGITANGNAQVDTAQSKFGGSSLLLDGTGDWLDTTGVNISRSDNFTCEAWIRLATLPGTNSFSMLLSGVGGGEQYMSIKNISGTYVSDIVVNNGSTVREEDYTIPSISTNTWYHWAIVKNGSTLTHYFNGTALTTLLSSQGTMTSGHGFNAINKIGVYSNNSLGWNGHLDEIRISNTARYTANFTAPTSPFVNDANTLLLIHADGTNASTVFEDDNGVRAKKGIIAINQAKVSTAQSQFGGSSAEFDGTNDYLTVYDNNTLSFGTGDYTVECWIRPTSVGGQSRAIFDFDVPNNTSNPIFYISAGSKLSVYNVPMGGSEGSTNVTANSWHHVVLSRASGQTKVALNGVWQLSRTNSYSIGNASFRSIGAATNAGDDFVGYIDEFRVSNIARYNLDSNFTAPTAPFVNDANTQLLIHADGTNASTVFTDDNSQLTVTPAATSVNEGSSLTFNVNTVNTADQTLYYSLTNAGDFATSTGSFSLTSNAGSFSVTPTADTTTEGAETFTASVRTGSTSGPIIATSSAVTINDTSITLLARPYTVTATGKTVSTAQNRFGGASLSNTAGSLTAQMNLPAGDFTIEYWARQTSRDATSGQWEIAAGNHKIYVLSGEVGGNVRNIALVITDTSGTTLLNWASPGGTLPDDTWIHIAIVRQGSEFRVYMNGTLRLTSTQSSFTMPNTTNLIIGTAVGLSMRGYIDEFRFSNIARYSGSSITVPTAAFTNNANTLLLLHMNGTNGSTSFPDDNA
jgi:hypothetical protein